MRLVLQLITTRWSAKSRGAPGATARNAVPEHLILPNEITESDTAWRHEVSFDEVRDFAPGAARAQPLDSDFESAVGLSLGRTDELLRCHFVWSPAIGAPARDQTQFAFSLSPGQTGRLRFNGRLSLDAHSDRGWQYQKFVYNIGWLSTCPKDVFEHVDVTFSSMEHLR